MEEMQISKTAVRVSYIYLISLPVILLVSTYSSNPIIKLLVFLLFMMASIAIPIIFWKVLRKLFNIYRECKKLVKSKND